MKTKKTQGFTIVELLTVMAVIAVLIGLLIPALAQVKDKAKELQQLAQFNAIEVGVELFKNEYGIYPESVDNLGTNTVSSMPAPLDPANYGGAQKLAEAMVGWDLLGYHPKSGFRSDGQNYFSTANAGVGGYELVYDTAAGLDTGGTYVEIDGDANIDARSDAFIELDEANAYRMEDVYGTVTGDFDIDSFVLCDVFGKKRSSGEKTGMPVLYYRANVNYSFQDWDTDSDGTANATTGHMDDIYNYEDNEALINLQTAETVPADHEIMIGTPLENFENIVLNEQVYNASSVQKPYRENSYILISAGKDGNYGTADDIMNFGTKSSD